MTTFSSLSTGCLPSFLEPSPEGIAVCGICSDRAGHLSDTFSTTLMLGDAGRTLLSENSSTVNDELLNVRRSREE
jgi:hypothetical protein